MIDTSNTVKSLNKIINGLDGLAQSILQKTLQVGQDAAKKKVKGKVTETLAKEIQGYKGTLKTTKPYARFVENGRRWVYPVNKKALKFQINGATIFSKSAKPVRARPFMKMAGTKMKNRILYIFKAEWKKFLK
jgi:uncharacterized protein YoxC